jgi:geranylgeranyl pyrophosphate synthase/predicted secreted hydrolase
VARAKYAAAASGAFFEVGSVLCPEGADPRSARFPDDKGLRRTGSLGSTATDVSSVEDAPAAELEGGAAACVVQSAWRSLADFRGLCAGLHAEVPGLCAPFPKLRSPWLRPLLSSQDDTGELRRSYLENWLRSVLRVPGVQRAAVLRSFLRQDQRPDWPSSWGPIDLSVHDPPHASSATEWWYLNLHFKDAQGNDYSAFAAFFRVVKHTDPATGKKSYAHALNWALTDVTAKRYVHESVLDKDSPAVVKKQLDGGHVVRDPRLKRAYLEILAKGNVPLPDRMFKDGKEPRVDLDKLHLDFESARLTKDKAGRYVLVCTTPNKRTGVELVLTPQKPPVRHGLDGVVKGHDGDDMFYYCIPRCAVTGFFTSDGVRKPVASGSGWYDHEFGGVPQEDTGTPGMQYAWNWAAIQLDNGVDVSVATLVDPRTKPFRTMESRAIVIGADGARSQPGDLTFVGEESEAAAHPPWTSVRTFNTYPTSWRVSMPSAGVELTLTAPFPDQEFVTLIAKPGFWEGRLDVAGTYMGAPVKGLAFIERNGFSTLSELDSFFKAVGAETRKALREVYPDAVDEATAVSLIATPETKHYIEGVDRERFQAGIIKPVRYISDQGGKSWRSYGALACMDVVGGDSRKFVRWLSMPEFMHVGSLIVDDIEDGSTKRRGAPCAHMVFGEPICINAGTAAYFQGQQLLLVPGLSAERLNKIYDYYFSALRAGHAGQALDILGLDYLMDDVIERGDWALAESRIIAIHRLKTAVPAASLARMGALVGGGTEEQIEAVGLYYESIGIAFQIMDDVLNLRGLYTGKADEGQEKKELKNLGEDITSGKVTIPVVKAIRLLPKPRMRAMWEVIKTKPRDRPTVARVIQELEDCGALDECVEQSERLVEEAYAKLDMVIPDSFSKCVRCPRRPPPPPPPPS